MKRFIVTFLSIVTLVAALGMPSTGCATFQAVTAPTPTTPAEQIDAMQRDLDTAKAGANLAHELGKWQKPAEWQEVQTGFANAQLVLTAVRAKTTTGTLDQQALTDLLNSAAQAVHDAKEQAKQ
jgi:hypothetical protein